MRESNLITRGRVNTARKVLVSQQFCSFIQTANGQDLGDPNNTLFTISIYSMNNRTLNGQQTHTAHYVCYSIWHLVHAQRVQDVLFQSYLFVATLSTAYIIQMPEFSL
jgi:hypothetical protein